MKAVVAQRLLCRAAACLALAAAARAADCRFTLADQSNWSANLGFYLNLENSSNSGPCQLGTLNIAAGVADANQWRFIVQTPAWQLNKDYVAKLVIGGGAAELWLDGALLGRTAAGFVQIPGTLSAGFVPSWASDPATYLVVQSGLSVASSTGKKVTLPFASALRPVPLMLLAPGSPQSGTWAADSGTLTATATFRLVDSSLAQYAPLFDRYLQSTSADWPGKIHTDADLVSATATEDAKLQAWGMPAGFDQYGGVLNAGWRIDGPQGNGPGFFTVAQHDGRWWLASPLGNPTFYIGLDTAPALDWDCTPMTGRLNLFAELPPRTGSFVGDIWRQGAWGDFNIAYACFNTANMIRKYGDTWKLDETGRTARRLKAWGFSGLGKWADQIADLPIIPVLDRSMLPNLSRHPDVFDTNLQASFRNVLAQQIAADTFDPRIVGWSLGNEYDEIITPDEITAILRMQSYVAAKRAFIDEALLSLYKSDIAAMASAWHLSDVTTQLGLYSGKPTVPDADVEYLRKFYARAYYRFIYQTVKSIDPNHLYFGFWIVPYWWVNEDDWRLIAPYCDVIGYDRYADQFTDNELDSLMRETAKPVFLGEFAFPATYDLMRGFRDYGTSARDDADSGVKYTRWLQQARGNPYCVGIAWFQYRDEPLSGRGPGSGPNPVYGEDFAFGMVDVGDRPKWDLVEAVRSANIDAARRRLNYEPPVINDGGVVNAASFARGAAVAPGSLISIFGTGLDNGTYQMGGYDVPVLYSSPLQVNAQVPWEAAGQANVVISASGGNSITVPLAQYSPGVFAVLPAAGGDSVEAGDYVTIYANGLGPLINQPPTGARAQASPLLATTAGTPSATIGGAPADVTFSGLAPGWIALYQVNVQVRSGTPSGRQPVLISIGGLTSNAGSITVR